MCLLLFACLLLPLCVVVLWCIYVYVSMWAHLRVVSKQVSAGALRLVLVYQANGSV